MKGNSTRINIIHFIVFTALFAAPLSGQENREIHFKWALLMLNKENGEQSITDVNVLEIDEESGFKFYFEPLENAYIYLYYYSFTDGLTLCFPESLESFNLAGYYGKGHLLPSLQDEYYSITGNPGKDRFYLFASPRRLERLEKLTITYGQLKEGKNHEKAENALATVMDELERLLKQSSSGAAEIEFPGFIAGSIKRKNTIQLQNISCESLYGEIITFKLKK